jgi:hypothetical protein
MDFLLALPDPHASADFGDVESLDIIQAEDVPVLRRQPQQQITDRFDAVAHPHGRTKTDDRPGLP